MSVSTWTDSLASVKVRFLILDLDVTEVMFSQKVHQGLGEPALL